MPTAQKDIFEKIITKEIRKRKHVKKLKEVPITTTNTSNILEDDKEYTSLSNTKDTKMKKKKNHFEEKTEIKKLLSNEVVNEKQKNSCDDIDTAHTKMAYNSKIYKCEVCEKLYKSSSSLNKHKAKAHILNEDAVIRNYISKHLGDEENTLILKKEVKKMKEEKAYKERNRVKNLPSNEAMIHKQQIKCEDLPEEYLENDIDTAHTKMAYNSKIYKCEVCEKLYKSSSSLNKHKAKAHILNEDAVITTYISKHLGDENNTLISNTKDTKMKKKKNHFEEKTEIKKLLSNEVVNEKQKNSCDDIDTAHTKMAYNSKIYKCEVCEKLYKSSSSLNKHKAKAHILNEDAVIRNYISKHLGDEENTLILKKEVKKMKEEKAYKERNRVKNLPSNEAMIHKQQIKCEDLPEEYLENDIDSVHTKEVCNSKTYKCEVCEKFCKSDSSLNKHKTKVHKFHKDEDFTANISKCIEDEECKSLLNTLDKKIKKRKKASKEKIQVDDEVIYHNQKRICNDIDMKMINNNRSYKCEYCEKSCKSNSSLDKHKAKAHILKKEADFSTTNISKCTEDNKVYTSLLNTQVKKKKNIRAKDPANTMSVKEETKHDVHLNSILNAVHINELKINKCNVCKKSFKFLSALNEHKTKCKPPYFCKVCGTSSHKCNICYKKFLEKSDLIRHNKRLHNDKNPFVCDVCNIKFTRKTHLTVHNRQHNGEKPLSCDVCSKSFSRKLYLTEHYKLHKNYRPYKCDVCKSTFVQKSTLTKHYRVHTGDRPYKCSICEASFKSSSNLSRHKQTVHMFSSSLFYIKFEPN